jgi:acetyltransferase
MGQIDDSRDVWLPGGERVSVRPLRPTDRATYERAVLDLSPRSRYLRFLSPVPKLSERMLDQLTHADGHRHVAYLALAPDEATGVAVVRYVRYEDDPLAGEVAIAVADDWQGRGLGAQLMERTVAHARESGLRTLRATTLRENGGSLRLLAASGFEPAGASGPYAEHELRLRA